MRHQALMRREIDVGTKEMQGCKKGASDERKKKRKRKELTRSAT